MKYSPATKTRFSFKDYEEGGGKEGRAGLGWICVDFTRVSIMFLCIVRRAYESLFPF